MKGTVVTACLVALLAGGAVANGEGGIRIESMPPVVVETHPRAGERDVDPSIGEIRVTFSKDMMPDRYSCFIETKESFPEVAGKPRYLKDKRTFVLPVRLKPGKVYAIWFNSWGKGKGNNFVDVYGKRALPYLLVFETKKR
jgi:hypothetical protein